MNVCHFLQAARHHLHWLGPDEPGNATYSDMRLGLNLAVLLLRVSQPYSYTTSATCRILGKNDSCEAGGAMYRAVRQRIVRLIGLNVCTLRALDVFSGSLSPKGFAALAACPRLFCLDFGVMNCDKTIEAASQVLLQVAQTRHLPSLSTLTAVADDPDPDFVFGGPVVSQSCLSEILRRGKCCTVQCVLHLFLFQTYFI